MVDRPGQSQGTRLLLPETGARSDSLAPSLSAAVARAAAAKLRSSESLPELTTRVSFLRHDDLLVCGTEPLGVEEHEVTTRGAFNPHGKGQVTVAVPHRGLVVDAGRIAAVKQEHGQMTDAERIHQATDGTGLQAKLPK